MSAERVWVILEQWTTPDDGDDHVTLEAVHATEAGANANLVPDPASGYPPGYRERWAVEMEVGP